MKKIKYFLLTFHLMKLKMIKRICYIKYSNKYLKEKPTKKVI